MADVAATALPHVGPVQTEVAAPRAQRKVVCADAIVWLQQHETPLLGCSFITSLPDITEFQKQAWSVEQWSSWFENAVALVLARTPDDSVAIFFQTDTKMKSGLWIDKSFLCHKAAARTPGMALVWSKVVCRVAPGSVSRGLPGYSHLLCYSKTVRCEHAQSTADVIVDAGDTTWTRGMGIGACKVACAFILENTTSRTVVDPFCGRGTVLAVANHLGMGAVGVDLAARRAKKAKGIMLTADGTNIVDKAATRAKAGGVRASRADAACWRQDADDAGDDDVAGAACIDSDTATAAAAAVCFGSAGGDGHDDNGDDR